MCFWLAGSRILKTASRLVLSNRFGPVTPLCWETFSCSSCSMRNSLGFSKQSKQWIPSFRSHDVSAEGSTRQFNLLCCSLARYSCNVSFYPRVYYSETWCIPTPAQQNNQTEKLTYGASLLATAVHDTERKRTRPMEEQQAAQVFQELRQPVLLQVISRFCLSLRRHRLCLFVWTRCYDTAADARAHASFRGALRSDTQTISTCETTWSYSYIPNFPERTSTKGFIKFCLIVCILDHFIQTFNTKTRASSVFYFKIRFVCRWKQPTDAVLKNPLNMSMKCSL